MIPSGVEIFVALTPIDLRWGFDRLAGVAQEQVGRPAEERLSRVPVASIRSSRSA